MLVFQLGLLLCLLLICSLAPGSYCVRNLPWSPLEKLAGAVVPPPRVPQRVPAAVHANDEKVYHAPKPIQKARARRR